jgi:hypothetical protein
MFEDFDFKALDSPSFKEDSVREEIIAPILRKVGYKPTGEFRVERSKSLIHPYVMIGSKSRAVNIIPDYTLYHGNSALMILDAKAPTEEVVKSEHVAQAYSYAIHPDVRCDHYALCNGRELIIYNTRVWDPVFQIEIQAVDQQWDAVYKHLHPRFLENPELRDFVPDFGLHAMKAGVGREIDLILADYYLQDIMKAEDSLFTSSSQLEAGEREFMVSFDYGLAILEGMMQHVPEDFSRAVKERLARQPFNVFLDGKIRISCRVRLGELVQGKFESFVPLEIQELIEVHFDPNMKLITPEEKAALAASKGKPDGGSA